MVLDRRACPEAMFIKGKALQRLGRYEEVFDMDMVQQILMGVKESDEGAVVDMKQYLFVAELNDQMSKPNISTCKRLLKLVPGYLSAISMIRKDAIANNITIEMGEDEDENDFINAFNDATVSDTISRRCLKKRTRTRHRSDSFIKKFA